MPFYLRNSSMCEFGFPQYILDTLSCIYQKMTSYTKDSLWQGDEKNLTPKCNVFWSLNCYFEETSSLDM